MGRPRLADEVHRAQGTRPTRAKAPEPSEIPAGRPRYPSHLSPTERAEFRKLAALLAERRMLTAGDGPLLGQAAVLTVRWRQALADVAARGLMIQVKVFDKQGNPSMREKKNLLLTVAQESEKQLVKLLIHLGLAPSVRDKVKPAKETTPPTEFAPDSVGAILGLEKK